MLYHVKMYSFALVEQKIFLFEIRLNAMSVSSSAKIKILKETKRKMNASFMSGTITGSPIDTLEKKKRRIKT